MLTDDRRSQLAELSHASDAMRAIPAYQLGAALLETLLSVDARLAAAMAAPTEFYRGVPLDPAKAKARP